MKKKTMGKAAKSSKKRKVNLISPQTIQLLINGLVIGGSALAGTFAVNKMPWIRDQKMWVKASLQMGMGVLALGLVKGHWMKKAATGLIAGSGISLLMPYMPEGTAFAGARRLTDQEIYELQTMGRPADMTQSMLMGRPANISQTSQMMGNRGGSRNRARVSARY